MSSIMMPVLVSWSANVVDHDFLVCALVRQRIKEIRCQMKHKYEYCHAPVSLPVLVPVRVCALTGCRQLVVALTR